MGTPKNHGKDWTPREVQQLKSKAAHNTPTRIIGLDLGRTEGAVYAKASELNVSLKPTNQSPYSHPKKK
jgi:hypothetical protein